MPVTSKDVRLCAELQNSFIVCGESQIPKEVLKQDSPIKRVFLSVEKPEPTQAALEAIYKADVILFGPGSLLQALFLTLWLAV